MSQSQGEPQVYGLYAVLVHSGFSCHAGHYFCYIKVPLLLCHSLGQSFYQIHMHSFVLDLILKIKPILNLFSDQNIYLNLLCCLSQASNGQWYQMNDSSVSISDIRSVLNQQAYVLFYIK